ncbi:MAG: hypothetical protein QOK66_00985 [Nitrososphaeraceae archaeon]|nr:hypothetical protein [Nitrososphaeraceae archaeon]
MIKHKGNQEYEGLSTDTKPIATDTAVNATFAETDTGNQFRNNGTAWVAYGIGVYTGLGSDTKPTAPNGSKFYETDTHDTLVSDGTYWWLETAQNPYSPRRWGSMQWGSSATAGQGMLSTVLAATGAGTQSFATDNVNGRYFTHATGTTIATKAGFRSNIASLLTRQFNPRMKFRLMLPAAADYTLSRGYFGFTTNTEPTGDDALNARAGFMVGWISGGSNFIVQRNDGTGATDVSGNVAGSAQALDTALHTVSIVADEPNSRFSVKWDANAYVHFTTEIPAATTQMTIFWHTETNEAAAKNFRLYNLHCESGK